jgi:hypothetical protein
VNELFRHKYQVGLDSYQLPQAASLLRLDWRMQVRWAVATAALFSLALIAILAVGDGTPFLYFQF